MQIHRPRILAILAVLSSLVFLLPATPEGSDQITWETRGPGGGGNFFAVSVHPTNPNIVLMGSDTGGIHRSADGGRTWKLVNDGLVEPGRFGSYSIQAARFTWDDEDPNIVYLGTLKSTNAGLNWHETVKPYIIGNIGVVGPGAANHNIVYTAGYDRVYRTDCAWDNTPACPLQYSCSTIPDAGAVVQSLVLDPLNPSHVIACANTGLYESTFTGSVLNCNGAWRWTPITNVNLPHGECNDLVLDAASRTLFVTLETHFERDCTGWRDVDSWRGGVYRTVVPNTGTTWGSLTWADIGGPAEPSIMDQRNPGFETGPDPTHPIAAFWENAGNASHLARDCVSTGGASHTGDCSLKITMDNTGGGVIWSDPIPVQTGGAVYKISGWAKVDYPFITAPCSPGSACCSNPPGTNCCFQTDGCTLYGSFNARFYWFKDAAGTDPLPVPGYATSNQTPALPTSSPRFDPSVPPGNGGWRKFETLILSRTGAGSVRIMLNSDGSCTGTTWVDDMALEPVHNLPRVVSYPGYAFASYARLVFDPLDLNTIYVGSRGEGSHFENLADTEGVWKTTNGGTAWNLVTRNQYQDNVLDGYLSGPICGDGICQGRGEKCDTCPEDCSTQNPAMPSSGCCGDNICATGEHGLPDDPQNRYCLVDCPLDPDPNRNVGGSEYFDATQVPYSVWGLGIGSGSAGRNTLYWGFAQAYVTTNAGGRWTELSADHQINATLPTVTWKARGDTNAVIVYSVVTDPRAPERIYYGDTDNYLQISYDYGTTFAKEGAPDWSKLVNPSNPMDPQPIYGDACTAILLDKDDKNRIYVGVATGDLGGGTGYVGVAQGDYDPNAPNKNPWTWKPLGDQHTLPQTGGVQLVRDGNGKFYAAIYGAGVYQLSSTNPPNQAWTTTCTSPGDCSNWQPAPPNGWNTYDLARDVESGRLYVSAGNPYVGYLQPAGDTGVWARESSGSIWTKITQNSLIDQESITSVLPNGRNTLFVATTYAEEANTTDGGLYKGDRSAGGSWSWSRVLEEPKVTGVAISPADNSIVYAFSAQVCCYNTVDIPGQQAGIWRSLDGGKIGTWGSAPLANNGLMDLSHGRLFFSENDPHVLFASTIGAGLFQGTITCTDPVRDFECSTRLNPSNPVTLDGVVTSGSLLDLKSGSLDDTYQVFTESGPQKNKRLTQVWTFTGGLVGVSYDLRAEGFVNSNANDSFTFSFTTRASGNCTGLEPTYTNLSPALSTSTQDDLTQKYTLGPLPAGAGVFCLKVKDSLLLNDNQADSLTLDRVYLVPTPPVP